MKKIFAYFAIAMMTFGISSCSNSEEPKVTQRSELNYKISPEEAIEIVTDFLSAQESASQSRSTNDNNDEYQSGGTSNYKYHLQYSIINRK